MAQERQITAEQTLTQPQNEPCVGLPLLYYRTQGIAGRRLLPEDPAMQGWAERRARHELREVYAENHDIWQGILEVIDSSTGERQMITLAQFVDDKKLKYRSTWMMEQEQKEMQIVPREKFVRRFEREGNSFVMPDGGKVPIPGLTKERKPVPQDIVKQIISRASRSGLLICELTRRPIGSGSWELSHVAHNGINTPDNLQLATPWGHFEYHWVHRDNPETIELTPVGNVRAMEKIHERLEPHEQEWARQLIGQFVSA